MSLFEFIVSMISVLIALAVAQLLISVGRLAQSHGRVVPYLPHVLWNVAIFLIAFLHWWSLWDFRDLAWNSAMFFYSLMGPLLLFFAVTLLSPNPRADDEVIDLEAHYRAIRVLFLWVFLAGLVFMTLDGPLFGTEPPFNTLRATQSLFALCVIVALVSERTAVQVLSAGIVVLTLLYATFVRFLPGAISAGLPLSG
ncbi:MAG: hypothetical protein V2I57_13105 [Xanthomonadales bacterium]|jgi:hypothetical protein|nr:hypothetical protein [Xanthomonadales bacterium]